ncbi:MAG: hypoxanthine phosphoribosyltransferase [Candidatus Komeilibacteria bacterium]|jgi:hypoxanthine phosphoribosyltransferase|nr:hypoxanthine phosphoribosyltransferase [Candidatus Komeilibacteria bacterium]MBT4447778.1 hypoxanthine phosphoribosyltransferase [Candidatus Komeilibacteria bacterium]
MNSLKGDIVHILFTKEQIAIRVKELADQLVVDLPESDQPPIFVNIMGGAAHFFVHLTEAIGDRGQLIEDFMAVKSYDEDKSTGSAKILIDLLSDIADRDIVIVEDIIDSGITMRAILDLLSPRKPRSIRVCTLLDKAEARQVDDLQVDYVGFTVGDHFVVGYGLDSRQGYRHLPYIGVLKT